MIIDVLGKSVTVDRTKNSPEIAKLVGPEAGNDTIYGYFDEIHQKIYVARDLPWTTTKNILTHEIIHAFLRYSGIAEVLGDNQEEAICNAMETAHAVMTDAMRQLDQEEINGWTL
jgi:hypothetical protein